MEYNVPMHLTQVPLGFEVDLQFNTAFADPKPDEKMWRERELQVALQFC